MDCISDLEVCQSSVSPSADEPAVAQGPVRGAGRERGGAGEGLRAVSPPCPSTLALPASTVWTDYLQAPGLYWAIQSGTHDSSEALPFCCALHSAHPSAPVPAVHPPSLSVQIPSRPGPGPAHTVPFPSRVPALTGRPPYPSLTPPHCCPPDTPSLRCP